MRDILVEIVNRISSFDIKYIEKIDESEKVLSEDNSILIVGDVNSKVSATNIETQVDENIQVTTDDAVTSPKSTSTIFVSPSKFSKYDLFEGFSELKSSLQRFFGTENLVFAIERLEMLCKKTLEKEKEDFSSILKQNCNQNDEILMCTFRQSLLKNCVEVKKLVNENGFTEFFNENDKNVSIDTLKVQQFLKTLIDKFKHYEICLMNEEALNEQSQTSFNFGKEQQTNLISEILQKQFELLINEYKRSLIENSRLQQNYEMQQSQIHKIKENYNTSIKNNSRISSQKFEELHLKTSNKIQDLTQEILTLKEKCSEHEKERDDFKKREDTIKNNCSLDINRCREDLEQFKQKYDELYTFHTKFEKECKNLVSGNEKRFESQIKEYKEKIRQLSDNCKSLQTNIFDQEREHSAKIDRLHEEYMEKIADKQKELEDLKNDVKTELNAQLDITLLKDKNNVQDFLQNIKDEVDFDESVGENQKLLYKIKRLKCELLLCKRDKQKAEDHICTEQKKVNVCQEALSNFATALTERMRSMQGDHGQFKAIIHHKLAELDDFVTTTMRNHISALIESLKRAKEEQEASQRHANYLEQIINQKDARIESLQKKRQENLGFNNVLNTNDPENSVKANEKMTNFNSLNSKTKNRFSPTFAQLDLTEKYLKEFRLTLDNHTQEDLNIPSRLNTLDRMSCNGSNTYERNN